MAPKKKIIEEVEEVIEEVIKEEPRNFPVIIKETKQLKIIKASEYDPDIHAAI